MKVTQFSTVTVAAWTILGLSLTACDKPKSKTTVFSSPVAETQIQKTDDLALIKEKFAKVELQCELYAYESESGDVSASERPVDAISIDLLNDPEIQDRAEFQLFFDSRPRTSTTHVSIDSLHLVSGNDGTPAAQVVVNLTAVSNAGVAVETGQPTNFESEKVTTHIGSSAFENVILHSYSVLKSLLPQVAVVTTPAAASAPEIPASAASAPEVSASEPTLSAAPEPAASAPEPTASDAAANLDSEVEPVAEKHFTDRVTCRLVTEQK